ncbi:hypothetical protein [Uliginosibacterium gangwonense]|uniref:hypothetical protein n=1 Tax=Uliginosibacterium gangwonense TaxID=392736 RepID=UPI00039CEC1E|nr:hypothetical protein [Uliginosibacterium gangwonense]
MRPRARVLLMPIALLLATPPVWAENFDWSGSLRMLSESDNSNRNGLLAPARERMQAGKDSLREEFSLKGRAGPVQAQATLTQTQSRPGGSNTQSLFNELYWSGQAQDWHFTLGKKIVSWDVGQGFRPLDVIQQENRRVLYGATLEGVRVAMAERYTGESAWSMVLANPFKDQQASAQNEAAAAVRYYLRQGSSDWHVVTRWGRQTGAEAGMAWAMVINDSIEVHASALRAEKLMHFQENGMGYAQTVGQGGWQSLLGGSWTGDNQLGVLAEYWHDNRAPSAADWRRWRERIQSVPEWLGHSAQSGMVANLAAPTTSTNLQQDNLLLRVSWTDARWSPALDVLYTPRDHGRITTLSLNWQGDVWSVEGGWRQFDGPREAIARNLPNRSLLYAWVKYPF